MNIWGRFYFPIFLLFSFCWRFTPAYSQSEWLFDEQAQKIYNWLVSQTAPETGLVASFSNTTDPFLLNQASTYDQALAGIAYLYFGDTASANRLLDFFKSRWNGDGFSNFYSALNGRVGIEHTIHLGPNAWIGLFALHHYHVTGNPDSLRLALDIALWAMRLPTLSNGGKAMGPRADWGADWPKVSSTENNLSLYALLSALKTDVHSEKLHQKIEGQMGKIENFLREVPFKDFQGNPKSLSERKIPIGISKEGINPVQALDVIPMTIACFGQEELSRELGVSSEELLQIAEDRFQIYFGNLEGFDFTDAEGAKGAGARERIISLEWTAQIANVYLLLGHKEKTLYFVDNLDKLSESSEKGLLWYPYSSHSDLQVFPFAPWWRTPKAFPDGPRPGSVSSTCWRIFVGHLNPLDPKQQIPIFTPSSSITVKKDPSFQRAPIPDAELLPASLGSDGLMDSAWLYFEAGKKEEAMAQGYEVIQRYQDQAKLQQKQKEFEYGALIEYTPKRENKELKQKIFTYGHLNNVAAAWFLLGKLYAEMGEKELAEKAFREILENYSLAQIWDPRGWFWNPVESMKIEFPEFNVS